MRSTHIHRFYGAQAAGVSGCSRGRKSQSRCASSADVAIRAFPADASTREPDWRSVTRTHCRWGSSGTDAGYALATSLPVSSPTTMRQLRKRGASPLNYVHRDEPPILVIRGTSDKLVPYQQAQELTAAMDKVGAPYHFHTVVGGGHNPYFGLAVNPKTSNFPPNVLRQFLSHGSRNSFLGSLARC